MIRNNYNPDNTNGLTLIYTLMLERLINVLQFSVPKRYHTTSIVSPVFVLDIFISIQLHNVPTFYIWAQLCLIMLAWQHIRSQI